ncbi:MAG: hypothetical protein K2J77_08325 [Oscillospiraceae bacterium]|nr:hypothetical protein [Oscillospiraceae bacterium]
MDFRDIFSLVFFLAGVAMIIIAWVLMRKGLWSFYDSHKEWALNDLYSPRWRRGIESPYQLFDMGVMLVCAGIVSAIGFNFGFKAGGWALTAVSAALLAFNVAVRLKRVDREDRDAYVSVTVGILITICALLLGLFIVAMA